ncbi:hypothetical protein THIOKS1270005 [Thiocapsa sp. KS1]|nr:hypothetical protein THIOKS1270005 [Thiocapsa sp. KS1]
MRPRTVNWDLSGCNPAGMFEESNI